ncbi:relaxosome protein TraM [Pantoea agglomerans]|uniref:relaxosome protein TraM n=1 Tax=Enterobacter agglomerans TaxID=549 RepID=UPI00083D9C0F|nr:relaxosome protein TraM [Pantoea agglomerans]AOE42644.1 conjugal transfer protein [Pantoea agglomerans]NEG64298.1 conjugal transfer protein [Pantoea agglomerans]NKE96744.1 conjugal transfer protein [Pantoea agglomerans]QTC52532.1 conjugal transfer protein [Pantoea agglomerans]TRO70098.1 conjugal transfer protein [Pantoea agglomerans]
MARRNIYFKEKTEREVQELVQIELQNGATHGEVNFSSVVNELVGIGLMVKKHQGEGNKFDVEEFNRDLIRRVAGTREGASIMMAMLTEMYLHIRGESGPQALEEMIDQNLTGMSAAEDKAESKHFIKDE